MDIYNQFQRHQTNSINQSIKFIITIIEATSLDERILCHQFEASVLPKFEEHEECIWQKIVCSIKEQFYSFQIVNGS